MKTFDRDRDGHLVVMLHIEEVQLLAALATNVREVLEAPTAEDPITQRLFPRAYTDPTEEVAEQQWQAMVRDGLVADRVRALDELAGRLEREAPERDVVRVVLDEEGEAHLLGAVNDMRLALGAALGVTADARPEDYPPGSPWELYDWLTEFQEILVRFLLRDLPDDPG